jgi:hypothetical protein
MKKLYVFFTVIGILFCALVPGITQTPQPGSQRDQGTPHDTFIVSGTLVRQDGSPIAGIWVQIVEAKGSGFVIRPGKGGVLENPDATTEARKSGEGAPSLLMTGEVLCTD